MAKLFLSYSRKDAPLAKRFTRWLEQRGHDVWRDEDNIRGGASFSSEIERALHDCDAVLVLWSAHSVQSPWVRDEAGFGRDAGKLIPFSLDGKRPATWIPAVSVHRAAKLEKPGRAFEC